MENETQNTFTKFLKQGSPLMHGISRSRSSGPIRSAKVLVASFLRSSANSDARAKGHTTWLPARAWMSPLERTSLIAKLLGACISRSSNIFITRTNKSNSGISRILFEVQSTLPKVQSLQIDTKTWKNIVYHANKGNLKLIVQNHDPFPISFQILLDNFKTYTTKHHAFMNHACMQNIDSHSISMAQLMLKIMKLHKIMHACVIWPSILHV